MPGDGSLDLDRFATTLLDRGWEGTVSLEVLNEAWATLPVGEVVARAHRSSTRYWR
ncbi:MAG TPA: hypothetical protein VFI47_08395 [Acidimicrobiales bacterium]|nr:hypothetical protein [Acidimicrobiales bacterium]